jgi:hypothetical protein
MAADETTSAVSRRRKIVFRVIFLTLQGLLAFVVLEVVCRVLDPMGISYYPETAEYISTLIVEEPIGYRNRPNLQGEYYGVPVSINSLAINSLGLRDREIPPAPTAGEYRIAVLGDSVPFGIGVDFMHTIPHGLEKALGNASGESGKRIRSINFGTISYNTEQELMQLETLGMRLHPDLVVLMFMENDIQPKTWILDKRKHWYVRAVERSYAASLLALLYKRMTGLGPIGRLSETYDEDNSQSKIVDRSLSEINGICRSTGIPFVVFTFSRNALVEEVGSREGFPVISLWADPYWEENGVSPQDYANSRTDPHPNAEGNRIYADLMARDLVELGVLPDVTD